MNGWVVSTSRVGPARLPGMDGELKELEYNYGKRGTKVASRVVVDVVQEEENGGDEAGLRQWMMITAPEKG